MANDPNAGESWLTALTGLGEELADDPDAPVTFLLGAGASISSRAPTFDQVHARLREHWSGRLSEDAELQDYLHRVPPNVKRTALRPLFRDLTPGLGYRCLAAIGASRPVWVITLNWDEAVKQACRAIGVECLDYELHEEIDAAQAAIAAARPGVVCLHIHGRLEGNIRYAKMETLSFEEPREALLCTCFDQLTVVAGASLKADTDLIRCIARDAARQGDDPPSLWVLNREAPAGGLAVDVHDWLRSHGSSYNQVTDQSVDFDRALLRLRELQRGVVLTERFPSAPLPGAQELVIPHPQLLEPMWDSSLTVIVGDPTLGKTTLAQSFAHWLSLTHECELEVLAASGPFECMDALADAAAARKPVILILDAPYGDTSEPIPSPDLRARIEDLFACAPASRVLLTSRLGNWKEGDWEPEQGSLTTPAALRLSGNPEDWYSDTSLRAYLELRAVQFPRPDMPRLCEALQRRDLNTPAQITAALQGFDLRRDGDASAVVDKRRYIERLLGQGAPEAALLLLVRLQEYAEHVVTHAELTAAAGIAGEPPTLGMLHRYDMDGVARMRLLHSTDRDAVDGAMRACPDAVQSRIVQLGASVYWLGEAFAVWHAIEGADNRRTTKELRANWGTALLAPMAGRSTQRAARLALRLAREASDFWALCEVTYEVTRLWEGLRREGRFASTYLELVSSRPAGVFALLEPLIFWHDTKASQIWNHIGIGIETISDDYLAGLIFDSLVWRPDALSPERLETYAQRLIETAATRPELQGAIAFACAYHPDGADSLRAAGFQAQLEDLRIHDERQARGAMRLFAFHYLHECRNRALLPRRDYGESLRRYLGHKQRPPGPPESQLVPTALVRDIARHERYRGWALHAALNYGIVHGRLPDTLLIELASAEILDRDSGILSAVLACQIPRAITPHLRSYFARTVNKEALLHAMRSGLQIDGTHASRPRFQISRAVPDIYADLQIHWDSMPKRLPGRDHGRLMEQIRSAAANIAARAGGPPAWALQEVVRTAAYGDLRAIATAFAARDGDNETLEQALEVAAGVYAAEHPRRR
jgi:hypothetical protein